MIQDKTKEQFVKELGEAASQTAGLKTSEAGLLVAEKALKESQDRLLVSLETASEGIWSLDSEFRTVFVNAGMAEMLGYHPEEMLGKTLYSSMFEEDLPDYRTRMTIP